MHCRRINQKESSTTPYWKIKTFNEEKIQFCAQKRKGWDSNPRGPKKGHGSPGRPIGPLWHPSFFINSFLLKP